jgi:hypothetical protein
MKAINKTIEAIKRARYVVASLPATALMTLNAMADEGETANVRGALPQNEAGMSAVADSSFTAEGSRELFSTWTDVAMYAMGGLGIIMAGIGVYKLWKHMSDGEQSRGSAFLAAGMILVGGLMTIPAIMTAIAPNALVGAEG